MGIVKGGFLRLFQTALYALAFCCAGIILGIYSYFLSILADRDQFIPKYTKAVEGISGIAVVYTIFAVLLTCCLGGVSFFSFLAVVLDIVFVGGFIALAILTRDGAKTCNNFTNTPLGLAGGAGFGGTDNEGDNSITFAVKNRTACRLNKACFAVAIIGAFLFIITAAFQVVLVRHHKKEKRYGPSPANNYTSGPAKRRGLFSRKKNAEKDAEYGPTGTAVGAGGLGVAQPDTRPSYETGTTLGGAGNAGDKLHGAAAAPSHGAYHTAPTGTANNPYYSTGTATNY